METWRFTASHLGPSRGSSAWISAIWPSRGGTLPFHSTVPERWGSLLRSPNHALPSLIVCVALGESLQPSEPQLAQWWSGQVAVMEAVRSKDKARAQGWLRAPAQRPPQPTGPRALSSAGLAACHGLGRARHFAVPTPIGAHSHAPTGAPRQPRGAHPRVLAGPHTCQQPSKIKAAPPHPTGTFRTVVCLARVQPPSLPAHTPLLCLVPSRDPSCPQACAPTPTTGNCSSSVPTTQVAGTVSIQKWTQI